MRIHPYNSSPIFLAQRGKKIIQDLENLPVSEDLSLFKLSELENLSVIIVPFDINF